MIRSKSEIISFENNVTDDTNKCNNLLEDANKSDSMKWYEDDKEFIAFLKLLVDSDLIQSEQEFVHFLKNLDAYDEGYFLAKREKLI